MSRIVFITGTDTGVGKTLFTALLLFHLRQQNCRAIAMKPFCSGNRGDVFLFQKIQKRTLPVASINPFYFPDPIAPYLAARKRGRSIYLDDVLEKIHLVKEHCDILLIEGIGGLLVPLGKDFFVLDLIARLPCEVVVVAADKLGTINHTLLTVKAIQTIGIKNIKVIMMSQKKRDISTQTNLIFLRERLEPGTVFTLPYLGKNVCNLSEIKKTYTKVKKSLARISLGD